MNCTGAAAAVKLTNCPVVAKAKTHPHTQTGLSRISCSINHISRTQDTRKKKKKIYGRKTTAVAEKRLYYIHQDREKNFTFGYAGYIIMRCITDLNRYTHAALTHTAVTVKIGAVNLTL